MPSNYSERCAFLILSPSPFPGVFAPWVLPFQLIAHLRALSFSHSPKIVKTTPHPSKIVILLINVIHLLCGFLRSNLSLQVAIPKRPHLPCVPSPGGSVGTPRTARRATPSATRRPSRRRARRRSWRRWRRCPSAWTPSWAPEVQQGGGWWGMVGDGGGWWGMVGDDGGWWGMVGGGGGWWGVEGVTMNHRGRAYRKKLKGKKGGKFGVKQVDGWWRSSGSKVMASGQ